MADFLTAYNWMMDNEDAPRAYKTVPDAPPGAFAISGINSVAFPARFAAINALPQASRGGAVQSFYHDIFWNQWLDQVTSDEVAKRVFDAAVNMGQGTAVKILQAAVNWTGDASTDALQADGVWGPNTLAEVNKCDPDQLVQKFKDLRVSHYQRIVDANPSDQQYLAQWTERASK
jgi:lysozyme family protein